MLFHRQSRALPIPLWLCLCAIAALLAFASGPAHAQASRCESAAREWASQCAAKQAISLSPLRCTFGFASFRAAHEGAVLDVEVRADARGAFRIAGNRGLSPLGEFPDWSATPAALQSAFDKVASCSEEGIPDAVFASAARAPSRAHNEAAPPAAPAPTPWRLVAAFVATAFVGISLARRVRPRRLVSTAALLSLLGAATWLYRYLLFPKAFFHQNGHGPMWVDCALGGHCSYGPGFRELFGMAAEANVATAEQGVFFAQGLLAATAPTCAWLIARAVGSPRLVAWALAFVVAIEPGLGRLAQSESYFGVVTWLLLGAAALLATGARWGSRSLAFAIAMSGAGLLIGQAAVVHPIAWIPSALVPFVVLVGRGSPRRRWGLFFTAAAGTGFVALASSGPIVLRIYEEHRRWGSFFGSLLQERLSTLVLAAIVVLVLVSSFGALRRRSFLRGLARLETHALRTIALAVAWGIGAVLHPFGGLTPWIRHAWWGPYLPAILAAFAAVLASLAARRAYRARVLAATIVALGTASSIASFGAQTALPTDALEARFATTWREKLPNGARVSFLERAGQRITTLPIYPAPTRNIRAIRLRLDDSQKAPQPEAMAFGYYYRSSLCSSEAARAYCDELERGLVLEPIDLATFPARPSMPHLPYDTDEVRVGLYRVQGRSSRASAEN